MRARLLGFKSETAGLFVESLVNETNILEAQLQSNVRIFCTYHYKQHFSVTL